MYHWIGLELPDTFNDIANRVLVLVFPNMVLSHTDTLVLKQFFIVLTIIAQISTF